MRPPASTQHSHHLFPTIQFCTFPIAPLNKHFNEIKLGITLLWGQLFKAWVTSHGTDVCRLQFYITINFLKLCLGSSLPYISHMNVHTLHNQKYLDTRTVIRKRTTNHKFRILKDLQDYLHLIQMHLFQYIQWNTHLHWAHMPMPGTLGNHCDSTQLGFC